MANKRFWFRILVMTLVFGMVVSGCVNAQTDTRLNGTWKGEHGIEKYNNGVVEYSDENGTLTLQAIYTTNNGKVTWTPTHYFGTYLGRDPRWYSKNELEENHDPSLFEPETYGYIINGNKLTYTYDDDEPYTLTLVSRDGKFTRATSNSTKFVPIEKSSGSVSSFPGRWSLVEGPTRNNPEEMDLLKDGTGIVDGAGISWKIENGRFYLIHPLMAFSSIYNVSGSTLTLTKDDGVVLKYKKK